jgi:hypothetical protein
MQMVSGAIPPGWLHLELGLKGHFDRHRPFGVGSEAKVRPSDSRGKRHHRREAKDGLPKLELAALDLRRARRNANLWAIGRTSQRS